MEVLDTGMKGVHCDSLCAVLDTGKWLDQWCTEEGVWGFKPPPPKFRRPSKIVPNSTQL